MEQIGHRVTAYIYDLCSTLSLFAVGILNFLEYDFFSRQCIDFVLNVYTKMYSGYL